MAEEFKINHKARWPFHGWIGIFLIVVFWTLNWTLDGLRTHWGFFPLWLGYCLTIDAWVCFRKGSSLLSRSFKKYIGLFFISIPSWWLFELINIRTQYWYYEGRNYFTDLEYFLFASLSFSTVIPAVFETAELVSTFPWLNRIKNGSKLGSVYSTSSAFKLFIIGLIMLALLLAWPQYFVPFMWIAIYFILEALNSWFGNSTLIEYTSKRDWKLILALWTGCLICGFFWEMWNYYSFPKWKYVIPFVDFLYIFEMPLLGYLGYLPFALELYAIYNLLIGKVKAYDNYLRIDF